MGVPTEFKMQNEHMRVNIRSTIHSHKWDFKKLFCTKTFS